MVNRSEPCEPRGPVQHRAGPGIAGGCPPGCLSLGPLLTREGELNAKLKCLCSLKPGKKVIQFLKGDKIG